MREIISQNANSVVVVVVVDVLLFPAEPEEVFCPSDRNSCNRIRNNRNIATPARTATTAAIVTSPSATAATTASALRWEMQRGVFLSMLLPMIVVVVIVVRRALRGSWRGPAPARLSGSS